jgi:hypothetical protein
MVTPYQTAASSSRPSTRSGRIPCYARRESPEPRGIVVNRFNSQRTAFLVRMIVLGSWGRQQNPALRDPSVRAKSRSHPWAPQFPLSAKASSLLSPLEAMSGRSLDHETAQEVRSGLFRFRIPISFDEALKLGFPTALWDCVRNFSFQTMSEIDVSMSWH